MGVARDLSQGGRQDGDEAALGKPRPLTLPLLPSKQQGAVRPVTDQEGAESEVFAGPRGQTGFQVRPSSPRLYLVFQKHLNSVRKPVRGFSESSEAAWEKITAEQLDSEALSHAAVQLRCLSAPFLLVHEVSRQHIMQQYLANSQSHGSPAPQTDIASCCQQMKNPVQGPVS